MAQASNTPARSLRPFMIAGLVAAVFGVMGIFGGLFAPPQGLGWTIPIGMLGSPTLWLVTLAWALRVCGRRGWWLLAYFPFVFAFWLIVMPMVVICSAASQCL